MAVIPNMTEVFVECGVLYLLYQDVLKYVNELFAVLSFALYWHCIKSNVGGGVLLCSLAIITVFLT